MKKILFLVPSLGMGGMERMLINVTNALVKKGHAVTVINLSYHNDNILSLLDDRVRYLYNYAPVKNIYKCSIENIMKGNFRILPFKWWTKIHSARFLNKKYVLDEYDVQIAFFFGYVAKIVSGASKPSKKIFWCHDEVFHIQGNKEGFFTQGQVNFMYQCFDTTICITQKIASDFENKFIKAKQVVAISNINDIRYITKKGNEVVKKTNTFTIISVGRIVNNHKGFDRLLEVIKKLNEEKIEVNLWLVGDGRDLNFLKEYAKQDNIKNVVFWGIQKNPYKFIKNADLFVCPSRYEGYGLVVAESLILGTPVLSTKCTGPCEILDNGIYGMIVENSFEGLYRGIKKIIKDKKLYNHYKEQTKKRMDFFNEEKIIDQIEKVL